ncbi:MAG: hypothetical protein D6812_00010 [Deltaproteobacteria bacterium]|nr:MAG: hypothetical protein D6812_00010 [Deltaproteobacteria bacterium]
MAEILHLILVGDPCATNIFPLVERFVGDQPSWYTFCFLPAHDRKAHGMEPWEGAPCDLRGSSRFAAKSSRNPAGRIPVGCRLPNANRRFLTEIEGERK